MIDSKLLLAWTHLCADPSWDCYVVDGPRIALEPKVHTQEKFGFHSTMRVYFSSVEEAQGYIRGFLDAEQAVALGGKYERKTVDQPIRKAKKGSKPSRQRRAGA